MYGRLSNGTYVGASPSDAGAVRPQSQPDSHQRWWLMQLTIQQVVEAKAKRPYDSIPSGGRAGISPGASGPVYGRLNSSELHIQPSTMVAHMVDAGEPIVKVEAKQPTATPPPGRRARIRPSSRWTLYGHLDSELYAGGSPSNVGTVQPYSRQR